MPLSSLERSGMAEIKIRALDRADVRVSVQILVP
jgi:hypothetical protein